MRPSASYPGKERNPHQYGALRGGWRRKDDHVGRITGVASPPNGNSRLRGRLNAAQTADKQCGVLLSTTQPLPQAPGGIVGGSALTSTTPALPSATGAEREGNHFRRSHLPAGSALDRVRGGGGGGPHTTSYATSATTTTATQPPAHVQLANRLTKEFGVPPSGDATDAGGDHDAPDPHAPGTRNRLLQLAQPAATGSSKPSSASSAASSRGVAAAARGIDSPPHAGARRGFGASAASTLPSSKARAAAAAKAGGSGPSGSGAGNAATAGGAYPKGTCDKCDGAHPTDDCPHYPKPRENHPDALRRKPPEMGRPCGNVTTTRAQVVRQPGDGSCLFHSLTYGLGNTTSAATLRREIARWVREHPTTLIAETPLKDWLWWDSKQSPTSYATSMAVSGWGGGIEMAACSRLKSVDIHVWEQNRLGAGYRRISCFDAPEGVTKRRTINVLYQGGVHYDALVLL